MSIDSELKKEHKKLLKSQEEINRLLQLIEGLMKEYNIQYFPAPKNLNAIIEKCIEDNGGHATYEEIYKCIAAGNVTIQKNRLSTALSSNGNLHYNHKKGEWEFTQLTANDNPPMDLTGHLSRQKENDAASH